MTVALRYLRDYRRTTTWWVVGFFALVLFTVVFYPAIRDQPGFDELFRRLPPAVRAFVGSQEGISITSPSGYLQARLFGALLPVLLLVFGIGVGARSIGGSEDDGTLELLLSNPVARGRVGVERYAALVVLVAALVVATVAALLVMSPPFGLLEGLSIPNLVAAVGVAGALALLHASVAFGIGCSLGRRAPAVGIATAVAAAGFIAQGIFESAGIEGWVRNLSPWEWYLASNALTDGASVLAVAAPLGLSLVCAAVGIAVFVRRDLH